MNKETTNIPSQLVEMHGLTAEEYQSILTLIDRTPTMVELGIFSAMWNEHCSYKSSKKWLRTLPTEGSCVIQGPGENAGVVDIGDGQAIVFKMESHNHPSFIEPYEGAATGVGGILRDIFTMGARPIAALNMLRFGDSEHSRTRHLVSGVISGIGGYGNSFGVPTVGGEIDFHESYNNNILVNAMALGLVKTDKLFYSKARGTNLPLLYLGSPTGRDGIHGASMASKEFTEKSLKQRTTVQASNPFVGKCLLEACLELMNSGSVIAIQDMGAAGLTSSAVEIGAGSNLGITLNLDQIPCREDGMEAYEIMLSETQERMLIVLKPGSEENAQSIFQKWGLDSAVIGETTEKQDFVVQHRGEVHANIPIKALRDQAPEYDRPWVPTPPPEPLQALPGDTKYAEGLMKIMGSLSICSRRWAWEQYDSLVMGQTIQRPGGDAAIVRIDNGVKGIAACIDVTPRYCLADPVEGGKQAVSEVWRNLIAVGSSPLAITDSLNFGNPERAEIMGQLVGCIKGIGEACKKLDLPVVSGNVSLYNESSGVSISPTPSIGGVGLLQDLQKRMDLSLKSEGDKLFLIGGVGTHLGRSIYLREIHGREEGAPPPVNLDEERRNGEFIRWSIQSGITNAVHDLSDGGMIVALAEMCIAKGLGASIGLPENIGSVEAFLFGEDQGRYLVTCRPELEIRLSQQAISRQIPFVHLGEVGGTTLQVSDILSLPVEEIRRAHENRFPEYMQSPENI